jgi:hypothetical protein
VSGGLRCACPTREAWRVSARNANYSAFNGYRRAYSDYSEVVCKRCGARWRTKARYVDRLKDR